MIFLGCDGGSTKTEWLLADETGRVLSHRTFAGCNYAFLGEEGFRDLMASSVQALLDDGKITADQVTSAMLSLTVYGEVPGTEESFPRILGEILPGCPIQIANDSVAGWGGSLAGPAGHQHRGRHRLRGLWRGPGGQCLPGGRLVAVLRR